MIEYPTSLEDPRLDAYARLTELQLRNKLEPEKGIFIAESDKVIDRALAAGYQPISLLVPEHRFERMAGLVNRMGGNKPVEEGGLTVFVMPAEEVEKLAGYELTRGVLCAMRRKLLPSVEETVANARRIAILEDITNHTNVGAAFRSAAALGVDAVLCTPACCDPLYRRAVRVSMGTVFQVPWGRVDGVGELRARGFTAAALALEEDAIALDDPALKRIDKLALVLGSEGYGLDAITIATCDMSVIIPMEHEVDSLNVAAASAVAFWELRYKEER